MNKLEEKVLDTIKKYNLIKENDTIKLYNSFMGPS